MDRDTGSLTFTNGTGSDLAILGYRITSGFQSLESANWDSIASNYDAGSPGPNQVDPDDNWTELSPNPNLSLSEFESDGGNGATLANSATIDLGSGDGVTTFGPWSASHVQDIQMQLLLPDGTIDQNVDVVYTGNSGAPFQRSDLDRDGDIDADDWGLYRSGLDVDLSGKTLVQAYYMGDLDGDLDNDVDDFGLFKGDFVSASSLEAFNLAVTGVPEPSTWVLLVVGSVFLVFMRQFATEKKMIAVHVPSSSRSLIVMLVVGIVFASTSVSQAAFQTIAQYDLGEDDAGAANGGAGNDPTTAAVGSDLVRLGSPTYSNDVPAGGSTLSMLFPGDGEGADGTDSFYYSEAPTTDVTQNITYTFDAKVNGTAGFQFLTSLGGNWGGISVVMFGNDVSVFFPGVGGGTGNLNVNDGQWHSYQVDYLYNGGAGNELTTLSIDGNAVSTRDGPTANSQIVNAFTLGGNYRGDAVDDAPVIGSELLTDFEGGFNGLIDNVVVSTFIQPLLTLEVNTTTGATRIFNDAGEPIEFDFYTIKSDASALNAGGGGLLFGDADNDQAVAGSDLLAVTNNFGNTGAPNGLLLGDADDDGAVAGSDLLAVTNNFGNTGGGGGGWNSLQDQNLSGFPAGDGTGNGWEESGGSGPKVLTEAYLNNFSTLNDSSQLLLGDAFDTSVFTPGVDGDLTFQFRDPNGAVFDGNISYVTSGSLAAATVPEPATGLILMAGAILGMGWRLRQRAAEFGIRPRGVLSVVAASLLVLLFADPSRAAITPDREYKLGESDTGSGTPMAGVPVGSTTTTGDTFDDEGTPMSTTFIDLTPGGSPVYANVSGRPLAGASTLGVSFDGVDDYLTGYRLGEPETSVSSTLSTQVNELDINNTITGTLDYSGISDRGYQFWVNPTDASLGNGNLQAVVLDSNQHGVEITGTGTWAVQYGGQQFDSGVSVKLDGAADGSGGWHHVMLVRPNGAGGGAHLYVDGQGVGAIGGGYNGADANYLTLGASTGNMADADGGNDPGQGDFFSGVIDNLDMFVLGENGAAFDYGTFDFATDNDFAANELIGVNPADVNRSGGVDQTDVAVFAPNFDTVNLVNGVAVPDLDYRDQGDLNFDGTIDLADAFILHGGLMAAGFGGLDFSVLKSPVPEPSTIAILIGAASIVAIGRRRQQRVVC
ncbi:MAG: PEP-CTERM sorting domain-containing protein [Bythopirellula sp.]